MFGGGAKPGDVVTTNRRVPVTFTDHLMGDSGGIPPGTRGVVVETSGWRDLVVEFDGGPLNRHTARVRSRDVRVIRRNVGVAEFRRGAQRLNAARLGVGIAIVGPFVVFIVNYMVLHHGTEAGLIEALINGMIFGTFQLIAEVIAKPYEGLVYLAILWAASRFAFGR